MTQLHELLAGIYCVDFRKDAYNVSIRENKITYRTPTSIHTLEEKLPPGNWSIICCSATATEEDAAKVVKWFETEWEPRTWRDYEKGEWDYNIDTATESLASLIRSRGLDDKLNWLFLKLD